MAAKGFVLTDAHVTLDGSDLSDYVENISLTINGDVLDRTTMGNVEKWRDKLAGLKEWTMEVGFRQDFKAAGLDQLLFPLLGTSFTASLRPKTSAVGVDNPSFSGTVILESYAPLGDSVGDIAMAPTSLTGSGKLTRATA